MILTLDSMYDGLEAGDIQRTAGRQEMREYNADKKGSARWRDAEAQSKNERMRRRKIAKNTAEWERNFSGENSG
ncbi:MAG: hypothetical protein ACLU38_07375 [Dysosmobacter sp.]